MHFEPPEDFLTQSLFSIFSAAVLEVPVKTEVEADHETGRNSYVVVNA